jgi:rhodanese-related sulfurtransferase
MYTSASFNKPGHPDTMANFIVFLGQQWMLVGLLLILVFLFIQVEMKRGGQTLSIHQLTTLINRENALVVDVRESSEFKDGHIVDALNVPFAKLKEKLSELEKYKDRPVVIVDKMGQHSGAAGKQLRDAGFNVSRLDGGMTEWRSSNLPVIKE